MFDREAGPATITLPDPGRRLLSMQVLNQDQSTTEVVHAPGRHTLTRDAVGIRYTYLILRTLVNGADPADVKRANVLQDAIQVPPWDPVSQTTARNALLALGSLGAAGGGRELLTVLPLNGLMPWSRRQLRLAWVAAHALGRRIDEHSQERITKIWDYLIFVFAFAGGQ